MCLPLQKTEPHCTGARQAASQSPLMGKWTPEIELGTWALQLLSCISFSCERSLPSYTAAREESKRHSGDGLFGIWVADRSMNQEADTRSVANLHVTQRLRRATGLAYKSWVSVAHQKREPESTGVCQGPLRRVQPTRTYRTAVGWHGGALAF